MPDVAERCPPVSQGDRLFDLSPSSKSSGSGGESIPPSVRSSIEREEGVQEKFRTHGTTISNEEPCPLAPISPTTTGTPTTASSNGLPMRVSTKGPPRSPFELAQRFLRWEKRDWFEETPEWLTEPDEDLIKDIVRPYLHHCRLEYDPITVQFFARGALNRLYTITGLDSATGHSRQCIFRIALPYAPWYKVENEVATTEYVRRKTRIPVPEIYAFDSSMDNPLGLEWMLMEMMPGFSLVEIWPSMSDPAKEKLAKQVAEYVDELSRLSFDKVGGLYIDWDSMEPDFQIGPMVDLPFLKNRRLSYDIHRGPFNSLEEYYASVIEFQLADVKDPAHKQLLKTRDPGKRSRACGNYHASSEDKAACTARHQTDEDPEDDEEFWYDETDLKEIPEVCEALLRVLPVLGQLRTSANPSICLYHPDLSYQNLLVDASGNITALVDWEILSTAPFGTTDPYPKAFDTWAMNYLEERRQGEDHITTSKREGENWDQEALEKAFKKRLQELRSPWLRHLEKPDGITKSLREAIFDICRNREQRKDWANRVCEMFFPPED